MVDGGWVATMYHVLSTITTLLNSSQLKTRTKFSSINNVDHGVRLKSLLLILMCERLKSLLKTVFLLLIQNTNSKIILIIDFSSSQHVLQKNCCKLFHHAHRPFIGCCHLSNQKWRKTRNYCEGSATLHPDSCNVLANVFQFV